LHLRGEDENVHALVPSLEDVEHVLHSGATRRSNYPDAVRHRGHGTFAGRVEEAFFGELCLELFEGDLECTCAFWFEVFSGELQFAARFVDGDASAGDDLEAVRGLESQQPRLSAEHDDAKLGIAVFQSEIEMSGFGRAVVGDLAFHVDVCVFALDRGADGADEVADGPYASGRSLEEKGELGLFRQRMRSLRHSGKAYHGLHGWNGFARMSNGENLKDDCSCQQICTAKRKILTRQKQGAQDDNSKLLCRNQSTED
jgi:hypothetical protein